MKRYRITFDIELNDNTAHPRKWVPDAVCENLEAGEDVTDWTFAPMPAPEAITVDVEAKWIEP